MWAKLNSDRDAIEEIIVNTTGMLIDGINYPKGLFTLWTDAERKAIGILPVTKASHLDSAYYVENNPSYAIDEDGNAVTETITKSADRTLATVKSEQIYGAKETCNMLLAHTDWYVVRKAEASTAIPAKITAYRTAIRTVYAAAKSAINGAANIGALVTVNATVAGASEGTPLEVDGTDSDVVSTSNNTITSNGHGFVDDEALTYNDGQGDADNPIKGLVSGQQYYIHSAATNTFKLSLTPSSFGDEAVISLTGVADGGTAHTFTSLGIPTIVNNWPNESDLAYKL